MKKKKIFGLFFLFLFLFLGKKEILAQTLSLSLSPPLLEVLIKPGKSVVQTFQLANEGEPLLITPFLLEFDKTGPKTFPESSPIPWITLLNQDIAFNQPFLLETGQQKQLILKIHPPKGTKEQDYYRLLFFEGKTPFPPQDRSQSFLSESLGSFLLLTVSSTGLLSQSAKITRFELPKILDSFSPLSLSLEVENTGQNYFRPLGEISLSGPLGKASFKITPNIILAGEKKLLSAEENLSFQETLSLPGFYLGKYQVKAEFTLGEGKIKIEEGKTFYALPWKAGLFFLLGLLLIWFFISFSRRKIKRKRIKEKNSSAQ